MRTGILVSLIAFLSIPLFVSAQSIGSLGGSPGDTFSMSVSPQYPASNSQAVLSFLSSSIDLTGATLKVTANGKDIYQGTVQPVAVQLGKAGSVTTVVATVTIGGIPYKQTLAIQPEDVALVVEPISSAPVLYPGKPSVPLEGDSRIVAVASMKDAAGKVLDPQSLSYTWKVDDALMLDSSGIGKTSLIVASPLQYRTRTVSVIARSQAGSIVGGSSISLSPQQPVVRMYTNDPLLGVRFDRVMDGGHLITSSEESLYAAPFSMPITHGAPLIQWFLNSAPAQTGNLITLRPNGNGQGSASLSLTATMGDILASTDLSLTFGSKRNSGFFGL